MGNELGSRVAYMFDVVKAGRPDFRHARIESFKAAKTVYRTCGFECQDWRLPASRAFEKVILKQSIPLASTGTAFKSGIQPYSIAETLRVYTEDARLLLLYMDYLRRFFDKHIIAKTGSMP